MAIQEKVACSQITSEATWLVSWLLYYLVSHHNRLFENPCPPTRITLDAVSNCYTEKFNISDPSQQNFLSMFLIIYLTSKEVKLNTEQENSMNVLILTLHTFLTMPSLATTNIWKNVVLSSLYTCTVT